jgi:hypothetical protein
MKLFQFVIVSSLVLVSALRLEAALFQGLGRFSGDSQSVPHDVSPDGSTVVGISGPG